MSKRISKIISSLVSFILFFTVFNTSLISVKSTIAKQSSIQLKLQIGSTTMHVNDYEISLLVAPELNNNSTFIPITAICYGFGIEAQWIPQTKGIVISMDNIQIGLQIGSDTAVLNGDVVNIPPVYLKDGIPMLPLRILTDGLNFSVSWDPHSQTIACESNIGGFNPDQGWITVFYPEHGSTVPCGIIKINNPITVQIYPDESYNIKEVMVDGKSVGKVESYTFSNVSKNYSIQVIFEGSTFVIDAQAGAGGTIAPFGKVAVMANENKTFKIIPNQNYVIKDVIVDGISVGAIPSYTFTNISDNHTIVATFEKDISSVNITLSIASRTATINGAQITLNVAPIIKEGRAYVPLRFVSEQMGCAVDWQDASKKITITNLTTKIELWIGKSTVLVNGKSTLIDPTNAKVVPIINNGSTLVPIRFISESLGYYVDYNSSKKQVKISNTPIVTLNKGVGYTEKSVTYNGKTYNFKIIKVDPKISGIKIVPSLSVNGYNKGADYKTFLPNNVIAMVNGIPFDTTTFDVSGTIFGNSNGIIEAGTKETFIVDPYGNCVYDEGRIEVTANVTDDSDTIETLTTYSINVTSYGGFTIYTNWYKDEIHVNYNEIFVVVNTDGQVISKFSGATFSPSYILKPGQYGIHAYQFSTNHWTKDTIKIFDNAVEVNLKITINGRDITNSFFVQSAPLVVNNGVAFNGASRYPDSFRMTKSGARVFLGTDGRYLYFIVTPAAISLRDDPVGNIILRLGYFKYVISLDGGGSTLLYYNGKYIYTPGRKLVTCVAVVNSP